MGFREFITSRLFRRQLTDDLERYQNIKAPANPSRRYIDKLVRRLLNVRKAWDARKELEMIGAPAVPSLAAAILDPRFHQAESKDFRIPAPLELVLELLVPHAPDQVLSAALPLVASPSDEVRKIAALHLASLGRAETTPVLNKLLEDSNGDVRSFVADGVTRALSEGRCSDEFRQGMYESLLNQCDQDWADTLNNAPETIVALDAARAGRQPRRLGSTSSMNATCPAHKSHGSRTSHPTTPARKSANAVLSPR